MCRRVVSAATPAPVFKFRITVSDWRHAQTCTAARQWTKTPFVIDGVLVYVSGLQAHYDRAVAGGAHLLSEIEDNDGVGQRQYRVEDPEGHRWMFAEPIGG